ncbi:hypothetical protein NDU88_004273 [Pleurodeles waltl]|uniref:Uncharacterized protein n=1 Tax=Pleurodeles waltl TaxID=8319 RepID=A0AAV7QBG4_PLEWA|nr:hypothetical protein NDU88_004273 [Pleurodeles waltl]
MSDLEDALPQIAKGLNPREGRRVRPSRWLDGPAVLLLLRLRGLLEPRALPLTGAAAQCELPVAVRGWLGGAGLGGPGVALDAGGRTSSRPRGPAARPSGRVTPVVVLGVGGGCLWPPLLGPDRRSGRTAGVAAVGVRRGLDPVAACGRLERCPIAWGLGGGALRLSPCWRALTCSAASCVAGDLPGLRLLEWPVPRRAACGASFRWSAALGLAAVLAGRHFALAWVPSPVRSGRRHVPGCCAGVAPPPPAVGFFGLRLVHWWSTGRYVMWSALVEHLPCGQRTEHWYTPSIVHVCALVLGAEGGCTYLAGVSGAPVL